jgi:hypothetical protein
VVWGLSTPQPSGGIVQVGAAQAQDTSQAGQAAVLERLDRTGGFVERGGDLRCGEAGGHAQYR